VAQLVIHGVVRVSAIEGISEETNNTRFYFYTVGTDSCVSSTRSCRPSVRRWGALTLGGLIGVIVGSIVGCCLLVTLVVCICKKMC
jgi:hypothetical protein